MSGQIIFRDRFRTDRKRSKNVAFCKGNGTPAISGISRFVKYYEPFGQIYHDPWDWNIDLFNERLTP